MTEYLDIYMAELSPAMESLKDVSPAQFINACNEARQKIYDEFEAALSDGRNRLDLINIDYILDHHGFALKTVELRWDYRYRMFKYPKGDLS